MLDLEKDTAQSSCSMAAVGMPIRLLPQHTDHRHDDDETSCVSYDGCDVCDVANDDNGDVSVVDDDKEYPDTVDSSKEEEEKVLESNTIIHLHPIMLHVLFTASIMASSPSATDRRWNRHHHSTQDHYHDKNHKRTIFPVELLPIVDNSSMTGMTMYGTTSITGSLEVLNIQHATNDSTKDDAGKNLTGNHENNDDWDINSSHTAIHLEYMCSTSAKGRNLDNSTSFPDNSRRQNQDLLLSGGSRVENQRIRKQLADMIIIVEGGILGIDMDENVDNDLGEDDDDDSCSVFGSNRIVVFYMVNKIVITKGGSGNTPSSNSAIKSATARAKYLRIPTSCSFDVVLDPPSSLRHVCDTDNDGFDTVESKGVPKDAKDGASNIGIIPRPPRCFNGSTMNLNQNSIHFICPGYEPVLEELLLLAKMMNNPDACPSAVLLSGCCGVGKSRMVCLFLLLFFIMHRLANASSDSFFAAGIVVRA